VTIGSENLANRGWLDTLLHVPEFWSVSIMLTIVGLLVAWEESIEILRESTPPTIQPVIDRVLGEIGGLGFIGLFLSTVVLNQDLGLSQIIGHFSETYLGDEEILLESFEFLHEVFFQTAIIFFVTTAFVITRIVSQINSVTKMAEDRVSSAAAELGILCEDSEEEECPMEAYEAFLRVEDEANAKLLLENQRQSSFNKNVWERELGLTSEERGAEILVLRERLKREGLADDSDFTIRSYLENLFSTDKLDFVEISPLTWLPLIPGLALLNSVDLEHDILPNSLNKYESCGFFVSTPSVIIPVALSQILCLAWAIYNFEKMGSIKSMLVPKLVETDEGGSDYRDEMGNRNFQIIRPDVEVEDLRQKFSQSSTPILFRPIETLFGKMPTNQVQELFGDVGGNGNEFFLNSIKFQLWLTVSSIMCLGCQILPRDAMAFASETINAGNPAGLIPELLVYGIFGVLNILELLIVPSTFLNYCLIGTVETFVDKQNRKR